MTTPVERLTAEAAGWPGIETASHRFGGTEFLLGDREVGHVHVAGLLDINFTRRLRDALVAEGRADTHHVVPDSGWVSYRLRSDEDVAGAHWLLRLSYLYAALVERRRQGGRTALAALDPAGELDALDPSSAVRTAVEGLIIAANTATEAGREPRRPSRP